MSVEIEMPRADSSDFGALVRFLTRLDQLNRPKAITGGQAPSSPGCLYP